jgi:DNA polymerase/3'-5' exonuclease PolX
MNTQLISQLTYLMNIAKAGNDPADRFRARSYVLAIRKIKDLTFTLTKDTAQHIPLSPDSRIYAKVLEFITNGHIEGVSNTTQPTPILQELQYIYGIGPVKARELVNKHGITTMKQMSINLHLLNEKQRIGFKYWQTDLLRIPRQEIVQHEAIYRQIYTHFTITGSYRRGALSSGDIDILITHPQNNAKCFVQFIDLLIDRGYFIDTLAYGSKKYMGYASIMAGIPRRIDVIYCSPLEYPFALLYFTGCGEFNIKMREYAKTKGYRLNEKGLFDNATDKKVAHSFIDEKGIFDFLGIAYVKPESRVESYSF